jgi:tRNA1(Val) A37 N6-methylase TrmN6
LLAAIGASLGGIIVCPVWSAAGKQASRIIVSGIKGIRTPLSLHSGLVLHEEDGTYTVAAQAILRDGGALNLDIS